jgi:hypothetical protein
MAIGRRAGPALAHEGPAAPYLPEVQALLWLSSRSTAEDETRAAPTGPLHSELDYIDDRWLPTETRRNPDWN